jgi:hypothetical protein
MNVGEIFQWDVNVRLVNTLRRHQASLGNFRTKWSSQWENHRRYVANPHHTSRRFAKILTYKYMTSHAFPGAQQFGSSLLWIGPSRLVPPQVLCLP